MPESTLTQSRSFVWSILDAAERIHRGLESFREHPMANPGAKATLDVQYAIRELRALIRDTTKGDPASIPANVRAAAIAVMDALDLLPLDIQTFVDRMRDVWQNGRLDAGYDPFSALPALSIAIEKLRSALSDELSSIEDENDIWSRFPGLRRLLPAMRRQQPVFITMIVEAGGSMPVADIAIRLRWVHPYDDAFQGMAKRLNKLFEKHSSPFHVNSVDTIAHLTFV